MKIIKKYLLVTAVLWAAGLLAPAAGYGQPTVSHIGMEEYLGRVATSNLEIMAEKYNVKIAREELAAAKMLPDPELEFEAGEDYFSLELGITFELGKRWARKDVAELELQMESLSLDFFMNEVIAAAAGAYYESLMHKELLESKRVSYDNMYRLSVSDSIRYALGEITENDARQSRIEALAMLNEVYAEQGEYYSSLAVLNMFMGFDDMTMFYEPVGVTGLGDGLFKSAAVIDIALMNRADLAAAGKGIEMAIGGIKLIKAERRPDIGVFVGFERDWGGFWPQRDQVKAGITIPLKFSNFNKGQVRSAKYSAEKTQVEYDVLSLQIKTEVMQAWFGYEAMKKQAAQFDGGLLDEAEKLLRGITYMYERGETDILEVLIAQRTHNELQEQYYETMRDYALSVVELKRACGVWGL